MLFSKNISQLAFAAFVFLLCNLFGDCQDNSEVDYLDLEEDALIGVDNCGLAPISGPTQRRLNKRILNRVSNGYYPPRGAFPFYVSVVEVGKEMGSRCGGTLITDRHLITAAHCSKMLKEETQGTVSLGGDELQVKVEKRCVSKKFELFGKVPDKPEGIYDIAVYKLDQKVDFSDTIQPACLPKAPLKEEEQAYLAGVGLTEEGPKSEQKLKAIPVKRVECLPQDRHESIVCTKSNQGYNGSGCPGDSGGPLASLIDGRWTVFGAVSYGRHESCPHYDLENQFADVFALREEIEILFNECL